MLLIWGGKGQVRRGIEDEEIGLLVGQPPSAGSVQVRLQEARPALGLGVRVPEDRQPHHREAPHPDDRIAVSDDLLLTILDDLVRLD